jgi:replicative DNA helicase
MTKKETPPRHVWQTQQWERELLRILLTDPVTLRRHIGAVKEVWMSDAGRLFIFQTLASIFRTTGNVVTREALLYELEKNLVVASDSNRVSSYTNEIEAVFAATCALTADFLIAKLEEAESADWMWQTLEDSFTKLEAGDLNEAMGIVKAGSLHLSCGKKGKALIDIDRETGSWLQEVERRKNHPESLVGVPSGFRVLDTQTGGFFPAELIVVFGLSGKGKSTVLKAMCNFMRDAGKNVLHVCNEENQFQVTTKYQTVATGIEYHKFKWGKITDEELENWKRANAARQAKNGSLFVLEIPPQGNVTLIQKAFYELEDRGIKIDLVCVDYMDLMAPTQRAYSENDEQAKVTSDLLQLAKDCNIPVLTATQASTATQKQEGKDKPFLTAQDVYGTKRKAHSANILIGIVNQTANIGLTERDPNVKTTHTVVFVVPKQRDGPSFWFKMILDPSIGRFTEAPDELGANNPSVKAGEKQAVALARDEAEAPIPLRAGASEVQREAQKVGGKVKELDQRWAAPTPGSPEEQRAKERWRDISGDFRLRKQR